MKTTLINRNLFHTKAASQGPRMQNYIVSTVGTSVLTKSASKIELGNIAQKDVSNWLRDRANFKHSDYAPEESEMLVSYAAEIKNAASKYTHEQLRDFSAECNVLFALNSVNSENMHYLLCTDTYQGQLAAEIVKHSLMSQGATAISVQTIKELNTASQRNFDVGMAHLLDWCETTLTRTNKLNGKIIFNLAGSFKSFQAYCQAIGMIYADEICYIFEGKNSELLRIPRLPLQFDHKPLDDYKSIVARMVWGEIVSRDVLKSMPEAYLTIDEKGDATLSTWGMLAWNSVKKDILSEELVEYPKLAYSNTFRRDYEKINDDDRKVDIQMTLANISLQFEQKGLTELREHGGLQYENYSNRNDHLGHFRLNNDWRITCEIKDGILSLRRVGKHEVNENP